MNRLSIFILASALAALAACGPTTPAPDYSIKVEPTADGKGYVAVPPECARWADNDLNFFDNQPLPEFGCADARNLALMVDRPEDLLQGRPSGPASGITAAGAIMRYENNQTRGLIYPSGQLTNSVDTTTAPTATSALSGETPASSPSGSGSAPGK